MALGSPDKTIQSVHRQMKSHHLRGPHPKDWPLGKTHILSVKESRLSGQRLALSA